MASNKEIELAARGFANTIRLAGPQPMPKQILKELDDAEVDLFWNALRSNGIERAQLPGFWKEKGK